MGPWTYQASDCIQACEFLKEAQLRGLTVEKLITHRYGIDEMNEAMEMNISMQGSRIVYQNKNV